MVFNAKRSSGGQATHRNSNSRRSEAKSKLCTWTLNSDRSYLHSGLSLPPRDCIPSSYPIPALATLRIRGISSNQTSAKSSALYLIYHLSIRHSTSPAFSSLAPACIQNYGFSVSSGSKETTRANCLEDRFLNLIQW